jgi:lipopolysaccharide export system protein LptA
MEAFGDVVITTAKEVVRGDRAVYDVPAEIATVYGNVTVSTETDQFAGNRAVMNLKTGVSTLYGGGDDDGRARALIVPQRPEENAGEGGATSDAPTDTN